MKSGDARVIVRATASRACPEASKDRYEREGPRLERDGELGSIPEPGGDDFESQQAFETFRRQRATP